MIRTDIIKKVRTKGDWTFQWEEIRGFLWGENIEKGIESWANDNMMYAVITYEDPSTRTKIKEVTFVSSR